MRYVFDIETNGLLDQVTKIHCIVAANLTTRKLQKFSTAYGNINEGLKLLSDADELIGHNIMGYDLAVIKKLYPTWHTRAAGRRLGVGCPRAGAVSTARDPQ